MQAEARGAAILFSLLLAGCLGFGSDEQAEGAPRWHEGDRWTFHVLDLEGAGEYGETWTVIDDNAKIAAMDAYVLRINSRESTRDERHTRADLNPIVNGTEHPFYRFPLTHNKTWEATLEPSGASGPRTTYRAMVVGDGTVEIGGQTHDAVHVRTAIDVSQARPGGTTTRENLTADYWFAPAAKNTARLLLFADDGRLLRSDELTAYELR